ncbi:NUDIX domain-containing protein [Pelagibacterium montanilacus]|uniref:NUDIX domain-containing protein n=1 Tax=Pelagibacterium montanilacus TaxID=2185280 RepID=UPI0013E0C5F8|nr:NUDIX domain-containing protein [Pelagibacterium montanilacus]
MSSLAGTQPGYVPFRVTQSAEPLGHVSDDVADLLVRAGSVSRSGSAIVLEPHDNLTLTLDHVRQVLFQEAAIGPPRGEAMPVTLGPGGKEVARIDRSALRVLGLWATKVHINGLIRDAAGEGAVWLSRRAASAAAAPGSFDTMVAGGLACGQTPLETARKEAWEEAGLMPEALDALRMVTRMPVVYASDQGLHQELLVIYDLDLPPGFTPRCIDGEIDETVCIPLSRLGQALDGGMAFKTSSALVCRELLARYVSEF